MNMVRNKANTNFEFIIDVDLDNDDTISSIGDSCTDFDSSVDTSALDQEIVDLLNYVVSRNAMRKERRRFTPNNPCQSPYCEDIDDPKLRRKLPKIPTRLPPSTLNSLMQSVCNKTDKSQNMPIRRKSLSSIRPEKVAVVIQNTEKRKKRLNRSISETVRRNPSFEYLSFETKKTTPRMPSRRERRTCQNANYEWRKSEESDYDVSKSDHGYRREMLMSNSSAIRIMDKSIDHFKSNNLRSTRKEILVF